MTAGASLEWIIRKGDYSGTLPVEVEIGPVRIEQLSTKNLNIINRPNSPKNIQSNTAYPLTYLFDTGIVQGTFKINGVLVDSDTDYAYDKKNKIISMYDSCRCGNFHMVQFTNCSGTNTGSENFIVNFLNYDFIHESAGVNKVNYQLTMIIGSELYKG